MMTVFKTTEKSEVTHVCEEDLETTGREKSDKLISWRHPEYVGISLLKSEVNRRNKRGKQNNKERGKQKT